MLVKQKENLKNLSDFDVEVNCAWIFRRCECRLNAFISFIRHQTTSSHKSTHNVDIILIDCF